MICNVAESTLTRLSGMNFLMNTGPEISVASTKLYIATLHSFANSDYVSKVWKNRKKDGARYK